MQNSNIGYQTNKEVAQLTAAVALLLQHRQNNAGGQITAALENIFDLLLWAEKKNTQLLESIFESDLLTLLIDKYSHQLQMLLSGMTLLLGNAKEGGVLISHILERRLGDKILTIYLQRLSGEQQVDQQQQLHILGSLLRVYHRHLSQTTYHLFINNDRCLVIDLCCRFFNCSEEITRTSVMNILMSILKLPFIEQLLGVQSIRGKVGTWCRDMCRLFRNELKDFDQHLLITHQKESEFIINSINDKIILWEDLSSLTPQLFAPHFYAELLLPLILGSLNTLGIPLFTLKFSLFLLNKLIPTIGKLNLLIQLGSLLFEDKQIPYSDDQLGIAILPPFNLKTLLKQDNQPIQQLTEIPKLFNHLNQSFMNILRSKDGRFLECVCVLIVNLLSAAKKSPPSIQFFVKKLGFGMGGATVTQISHATITHFSAVHPLQITRIIAGLLVNIQPLKYLDETLKQHLVHVFKKAIEQALLWLQKQRNLHPPLAQILQYDIRIIQSKQFAVQPVMKTDAALLFNNHIIENQALPFYQQLPETALHVARYHIVKALFLRNVVKRLVQECTSDHSIQRYIERTRAMDAKYIKSGEVINLPISMNSYRCKLQDSKVTIPTCLILDDEHNFIVGFCQNSSIRVISNFKYRHVHTELKSRKDTLFIEVSTARYNQQSQLMEIHREFILRQLETGEEYFRVKKGKVVAQEMIWVGDILRSARKNLPEFSLL